MTTRCGWTASGTSTNYTAIGTSTSTSNSPINCTSIASFKMHWECRSPTSTTIEKSNSNRERWDSIKYSISSSRHTLETCRGRMSIRNSTGTIQINTNMANCITPRREANSPFHAEHPKRIIWDSTDCLILFRNGTSQGTFAADMRITTQINRSNLGTKHRQQEEESDFMMICHRGTTITNRSTASIDEPISIPSKNIETSSKNCSRKISNI